MAEHKPEQDGQEGHGATAAVSALMNVVVAVGCMAAPFAIARYHAATRGNYRFGERFSLWWLVAYGLLFIASAFMAGVPSLPRRKRDAVLSASIAAAAPLAFASVFFVVYDPRIGRFIVIATPVVLAALFLVLCLISSTLHNRSTSGDRVLLIADPPDEHVFLRSVDAGAERKFTHVTTLSIADATVRADAILTAGRAGRISLVVLSDAAQHSEAVVHQIATLHEEGVRVRDIERFFDEWLGKLPVSELERMSLMFDIRDLHEDHYVRIKRLLDISAALLLMPALMIAIPIVWLANLIANRGPVFFGQERVGHQGQTFTIMKFRSMMANTAASGAGTWTTENDPRITAIGRLLRRTHLDELPQALNILRGDLAIVGPRPEQVHYVAALRQKIPFYDLRHAVRPGITGWAQVKFPYGATEGDALEKLEYDLYYLRHQSIGLDLRVCARTFRSLAHGHGR